MKIGILASHNGSTAQHIIDGCKNGEMNGEVCVVIANNTNAYVLERAENENIQTYLINGENRDLEILEALQAHDVELVLLLGYLKKLGKEVIDAYPDMVFNSHPSISPKFMGQDMFGSELYERILESEDVTGVTIHIVTEDYDDGRVVGQCFFPIPKDSTVSSLLELTKSYEKRLWTTLLGCV